MTAMRMTKAEMHKKMLDEHIAATVASWPPPTPEQVRKVTLMARAVAGYPAPQFASVAPEVTARRKAEDALAKLVRDFTEALDGCRGCGLSRNAHKYQEGYGTGYHAHEALTPDDTIKIAALYKKKIAAAEKVLDDAKALAA